MNKRSLGLKSLILIACVIIIGCEEESLLNEKLEDELLPTGSISGIVMDAFLNQPIAQVRVSLQSEIFSDTTDTDGRFYIDMIPENSYTLIVEHPDIISDSISIAIDRNDTLTITLQTVRKNLWSSVYPHTGQNSSLLVLANGDILATCSGDLLSSQDDGVSWEPLGSQDAINDIVVDNTGKLIGTGSGHGLPVYISEDNGLNWVGQLLLDPYSLTLINRVSIGPDNRIFIYSDGNLMRSDDDGLNWQSLGYLNGVTSNDVPKFDSAGKMFYAAGDVGIQTSDDNGDSWQKLGQDAPFSIAYLLIQPNDNIIAGTNHGIYNYNLLDSTWQSLYSETEYDSLGNLYSIPVINLLQAETCIIIAGCQYISNVIVLVNSNDNVWTDISSNLPPGNVRAMEITGDGHVIIALNEVGIFRSRIPIY